MEEGVLMAGEPVFVRWENTVPPHRKFYEVEVELSLFYPKVLVRRWGRIGTRRPRSIRLVMGTPDELEQVVGRVGRRRERHGYWVVREVRVDGVGVVAA